MDSDTLSCVVAEHADEASFLWLQRTSAVHAPNYSPQQFADLDERLAAHIDAGRPLRPGPQEREIRACAVHACALLAERTGMTERDIDNALWYRGQRPEYKARPRHRCRTVYY